MSIESKPAGTVHSDDVRALWLAAGPGLAVTLAIVGTSTGQGPLLAFGLVVPLIVVMPGLPFLAIALVRALPVRDRRSDNWLLASMVAPIWHFMLVDLVSVLFTGASILPWMVIAPTSLLWWAVTVGLWQLDRRKRQWSSH